MIQTVFCPRCGREYAAGFGHCAGCAVALVEHASPDFSLAEYRDEIHHSGRLVSRLRWTGAMVGVIIGPCGLLAGAVLTSTSPQAPWWGLALFGLFVGLGVGVPASSAVLSDRRDKLRQRLAELPRDQQLAVLGPLGHARGDTRRLIAPLLRQLQPSGEVIPAAVPPGRGDEPTVTEER
jgi:MFS family permease